MAVTLHDAVNQDGLFDVLGKVFFAQQTINTARRTTIPTEINDVFTIFNNLSPDEELEDIISRLGSSSLNVRSALGGPMNSLSQFASDLVIELVRRDNPQPENTLQSSLEELIRQMESSADSVDASSVTASVSADADNNADGVILLSTKRGDGLIQENILAEDLTLTAGSRGRQVSLTISGEATAQPLSADWPDGSGAGGSLSTVDASSSLLLNGDMEDEDDQDDAPDDWIVQSGQIGTTLKMTNVEVQELAIAGSPTTGTYIWQIQHDGVTKSTGHLPYNASGSALQSAIRDLAGFEDVTVSTAGTTPNFTHTITFNGVGGNLNQHTVVNHTDSGTFTPSTTTAGSGNVFHGGKALELDSDGAELTTLYQKLVGLSPETAYALSLWALADVAPAAGVITLDLVDGIGGTVVQDAQAVNNSLSFNAADLTTSWQHLIDLITGEAVFRTPAVVPDPIYLRLRISTAVSSGTSVFIDQVALAEMTSLYAGGPLAAAFTGASDFGADDEWTVTATNDQAGKFQEWFERNFAMRDLGLLLPSDSAGAETIPDSLVA